MKKLCVILLTLCFTFGVFAGCNRGGEYNAETGWDITEGTLSILSSNPEIKNSMQDIIDGFEDENPGITVTFEAVDTSTYANLLTSRFTASAVDIYALQPGGSLGSKVNLQRTQPFNSENPEQNIDIFSNIKEQYVDECSFDGNVLIAPTSVAQQGVFYKKSFMREYYDKTGKSVPKTWTEFLDLLTYMKGNGKYIVYGGKDLWPFAMIHAQFEATIVRPEVDNLFKEVALNGLKLSDNQYTKLMFQRMRDFMNGGYFNSGASGFDYATAPGHFATNDKCVMMVDGSWSLKQIRDASSSVDVGFMLLPGNDDAAKNTVYPSKVASGWALAKSSRKKAMAKKFFEYMFREDIYNTFANENFMQSIMTSSTSDDSLIQEMAGYNTCITIDNRVVAKMPYDTYIKQVVGPQFLDGTLSVEDALKEADRRIAADEALWKKEVDNFVKLYG